MRPRTVSKNFICLHFLFFENNVCLDNSEIIAADSELGEVLGNGKFVEILPWWLRDHPFNACAKYSDVNAIA